MAPVANAAPGSLRQVSKPKNPFAVFSSLAATALVLLEAIESQLVSRGTLCARIQDPLLLRHSVLVVHWHVASY
jgi:hypothetical protein